MNREINKIILCVEKTYARDISIYDKSFLLKSLEKRWAITGVEKVSEYCTYLEKNKTEAEAFFRSLNITYSHFFRNSLTFALLEQQIIPNLISRKTDGSEIRVWSAGCSGGQEAYSIAMLLDELLSNREKKIRFRIFATDISQEALSLARAGIYGEDSVQNLKIKQLENYFTKKDKTYTIVPGLRRNINFSTYDLLDQFAGNPPESIYGDFDIVFCSNLLFYYKADVRDFIIKKMKKSMSAMGYLVTGEAERTFIENDDKMKMIVPAAAVFQTSKGLVIG